jgi:DNA polymerase I-like protein with 3'-5' exonuclease and polymerase domains
MTFFLDCETFPIDKEHGILAPELVCLQYAINEGAPRVLSARFDASEIRDVIQRALDGDVLVAHNGAFDYAVLAAWDESFLPGIFKALASGRRGRDTMLREQLIDIREGRFIGEDDKLEQKSLDDLAQKYARMPLSKGALSWRTRYGELADKPVVCWPRPAVRYAEDDVIACRAVYKAQARSYESPDEWLQVTAAFVLHLSAVHGIRTSREKLEPLIAEMETERASTLQSLIRQGLWNAKEESVDQKALESIIESSCKGEGIEVPRTPTGKPKRDKKTMQLLAHKLPDLKHYSEYQYVSKILSTYCAPMKRGLTGPLVSRPNALVGTGRTSWGEPNLQNFPRREGIRDCIIPRPGNVWLSVDYDSLEVRTFAQVLYWVTGESRAGDFYKEDPNWDPHTYMASRMIGIPYEEGLQRKENDKFFKKGPRQRSKAAVFGVPGGMGAEKFRLFSKAQYNVDMTLQESQELKDFYLNLFPEVNKYFKYIDYLCKNGLPAKQFVSQRLRGGLYFPACANTFFQGLAADGAKRALIRVAAECYCNPDSPLFGCRITAFIHDEICLEVPEETAHAAAMEVVRLMEEEMAVVCPDIPIRATPALSRCWLKAAEPKYKEGKLIPWEDE